MGSESVNFVNRLLPADSDRGLFGGGCGRGNAASAHPDRPRLATDGTLDRALRAAGCCSPSALRSSPPALRSIAASRRAASIYWADILPATLLVAIGMGVSVAPVTTTVMASVDPRPCRRGVRIQQRGGAHRRFDRDSVAWIRLRARVGGDLHRGLPRRRSGRRRLRLSPDPSIGLAGTQLDRPLTVRFHGHNAETYEKPNLSAAESPL
jgi:hypothetical protein